MTAAVAAGSDTRPRPRAAVVRLPRRAAPHAWYAFAARLPSGRSLLAGFALLALALGGYAGARSSSVFAIRSIDVEGASPDAAAAIARALTPVRGESLLTLEASDVERRVAALPFVASVAYDRAFPNTLVVSVRLERPAAVVRRGRESWLVSERGRVLRSLARGAHARLARIWVPRSVRLTAGEYLAYPGAEHALRVVRAARADPLPVRIRTVSVDGRGAVVQLASGLEIRLGSAVALPLKLAVAGRVVALLDPPRDGGPAYLDLTVPERPVAGTTLNPYIEPES